MHLLMNQPPEKGVRRYALKHTRDWSGLNLEACWGNGMSIMDMLFNWGPEAMQLLAKKER